MAHGMIQRIININLKIKIHHYNILRLNLKRRLEYATMSATLNACYNIIIVVLAMCKQDAHPVNEHSL